MNIIFLLSMIISICLSTITSQSSNDITIPAEVLTISDRLTKYLDEEEAFEIANIIYYTSFKYNIDPFWFEAIGQVESNNWTANVSKTNDWGYWQMNARTFYYLRPRLWHLNAFSPKDLLTPHISAEFSAFYLKMLLTRFGTYEQAIKAYNVGPNGLETKQEKADRYFYRVKQTKKHIMGAV